MDELPDLHNLIRARTPARLMVGRAGSSYRTETNLSLREDHAAVAILLIGERPGLTTTRSLSAYLAFRPRAGHTDAHRNLISNIHASGTSPVEAAVRILGLAGQMIRLGSSGVTIKEDRAVAAIDVGGWEFVRGSIGPMVGLVPPTRGDRGPWPWRLSWAARPRSTIRGSRSPLD